MHSHIVCIKNLIIIKYNYNNYEINNYEFSHY